MGNLFLKMKFITIALIAAVAADTTSLDLKDKTPKASDSKTTKDAKDEKKKGPTTVKWEKTRGDVHEKYNAVYDKENDTMVSEMRKTWENYFEYAFKSKGIKDGEANDLPSCSSTQECGDSGKK